MKSCTRTGFSIVIAALLVSGCPNVLTPEDTGDAPDNGDPGATYAVSGSVTDEAGEGIGGVSVGFGEATEPVLTDAEGAWTRDGLTGTVTVTPSEDGWTFDPSSREVSGAASNVDFTRTEVISEYTVSGSVTDEGSAALENIEVSFSGGHDSVSTDSGGQWSQSGLTGTVTVTPVHEDWTFDPESRDVTGANDSVDFTATAVPDPEFTGTGRVTVNVDEGLADVEILFSGGFDSVTTSPTGYWTKSGLSGTVTVTPVKDGWVFDPESQDVSEGSTTADFSASTTFPDGAGTPEDPYLIATAEQLYDVRYHLDSSYRQINDIDLSGYAAGSGWLPIGSSSDRFTGSFDGDQKRITGLIIDRPETGDVGLFGYVGPGGAIHALELVELNVTGQMNVGGLTGVNTGTVTDCHVSGVVQSTDRGGGLAGYNNAVSGSDSGRIVSSSAAVGVNGGRWITGGLAGINAGSIEESWATGDVSGGTESQGGLVGLNESGASVSNSWASGAVTGSGSNYLGGLVGANRGGTISDSYAEGAVTGTDSARYIGGLVGQNDKSSHHTGEIRNSHASGVVFGAGESVGGLVGWNEAGQLVSECYATGAVTGEDNDTGGFVGRNEGDIHSSYAEGTVIGVGRVGGLAGDISSIGSVSDSFATGSVTGDWRVGGLVGNAFTGGEIHRSYSIGVVTGDTYVGGLLGYGTPSNCTASYWDTDASGIDESAGGEGRATAQMQTGTPGVYINPDGSDDTGEDEANLMYDGWDPAVWDFGTTGDYPVLGWQ